MTRFPKSLASANAEMNCAATSLSLRLVFWERHRRNVECPISLDAVGRHEHGFGLFDHATGLDRDVALGEVSAGA